MEQSPPESARFRRIYDGHVDGIRRYCYRRLPSADVDDATAEVFMVVWRRIDEVPEGDEAMLWMYGIARNVVRNQRRSARRVVRLRGRLQNDRRRHEPDAATQVIQRISDGEILEAVSQLRPTDQEVLRLAAWEGLKPAQIASVLDIGPHAASVRLGRARNRLARKLAAAGSGTAALAHAPVGKDLE